MVWVEDWQFEEMQDELDDLRQREDILVSALEEAKDALEQAKEVIDGAI